MKAASILAVSITALLAPGAAAAPEVTAAAPASTEAGVVVDRIVAVVNKGIVLQSEVEAVLDQSMQAEPPPPGADVEMARAARRDAILDTLIAEKLLDEEVRKLRVEVTPAEVDRVVKSVMADNGLDEETLKMALQRQGLGMDDYRDGLKKQLTKMKIIQLKVKSRVQVTEQDVKSKVAQRAALDAAEYRVRARHILFLVPSGSEPVAAAKALERARATLVRLERGEDFADVARAVSEDPGSRDRGGELGEFGRGEMVPEFERAAWAAEPGRVVGPVESPFGYHLIQVQARVPLSAASSTQVEEDIRRRLFESEVDQQFKRYVNELKRDAHIEKRL